MIVLGLTGSIGMGKSTTSAMFRAAGAPVYDADAAVHRLYAGEAVAPVGAVFAEAIVDGVVDRARLSEIVLKDPVALRRLESIVHPLVGRDRAGFLERCAGGGVAACVLDVPLLFETGGERAVDLVAVVSASADQQERRVMERPGMTREKLMAILAKQTPDVEKRRRAHFVIDTGRGLDYARRQVHALLHAVGA